MRVELSREAQPENEPQPVYGLTAEQLRPGAR